MRTFVFDEKKYGFELLMDLHRFEHNLELFFDTQPHTTDFFEIMIFQEGEGKMELNGQVLEVAQNSFFFICPFQKKSCQIDRSTVKGFHLVFQNDFLSDFFDDKWFTYRMQYFYNAQHPQYLSLSDPAYQTIAFALNEIIGEIKSYQRDSDHILRSLLYFALSKLNRLYSNCYNISTGVGSNTTVYQFKELLEVHIRHMRSVEAYAELLHINRHQMSELVKSHLGVTPKEVINSRLLQEVKIELRYSYKTVAEIAHELNFSEPNNLTRFFKQMEGLNPSAYRSVFQNDSSSC